MWEQKHLKQVVSAWKKKPRLKPVNLMKESSPTYVKERDAKWQQLCQTTCWNCDKFWYHLQLENRRSYLMRRIEEVKMRYGTDAAEK